MAHRERHILERSVHAIAQQAANTNKVIDEAMEAGLAADRPVTVAAKQVRLELLEVKANLERELGTLVLDCTACGQEVHWVQGVAVTDPGHWGRRFPAPHGEPVVQESSPTDATAHRTAQPTRTWCAADGLRDCYTSGQLLRRYSGTPTDPSGNVFGALAS